MPTGPKETRTDQVPPPDLETIAVVAGTWQTVKHQAAVQEAKAKEMNQKLSALVDELGEPDDKGHVWLQGIEFLGWENKNGQPTQVRYTALQRQKRTSVTMDDDEAARILGKKTVDPKSPAAETWATDRALLDQCSINYIKVKDPVAAVELLRQAGLLDNETFEVVTEISVDKVRDAYYDDLISEEEYEEIFQTNVTWALLPGLKR